MKRIFAVLMCSALCLPFAHAEDMSYDPQADTMQRRDRSPRPDPRRAPNYPGYGDHYRDRQGRKVDVGNVIARVIVGAIAAEALERDHYRRGYHGQVQCYAQNRRGMVFRASGNRPYVVQQKALSKCYNNSYECRPMGCRTLRW